MSETYIKVFVPLLVFFYQQHLRKQKLKYTNPLDELLTHVLLVKTPTTAGYTNPLDGLLTHVFRAVVGIFLPTTLAKYTNPLDGLLTHVLLVKKHQQRLEP